MQTTHIPPVEIEVPEAIASQLTVVHNARLDITGIRITKDGRENPEELTYEWTVSQTDNDSEAISLADRIVVLTPRPARVRNIHEIRLEGTPLSRREAPGFGKWFEVLWKELHT